MGKMADNERIKLKAMYFNNIAVGAYVGGCLVPFLAYTAQVLSPSREDASTIAVLTAFGLAMIAGLAGLFFRRRADSIIQKITD